MKITYLTLLLLVLGLEGCATKPPAVEQPVKDWQKALEQSVRDRQKVQPRMDTDQHG